MMKITRSLFSLLITVLACYPEAHEIQMNRLVIIQHDDTHLSLKLLTNDIQLIQSLLAPDTPIKDFILAYSSINKADYLKNMGSIKETLKENIKIKASDLPLKLSNWNFSQLNATQESFQKYTMQLMTLPNDQHIDYESTIEITADALSSKPINEIDITLPASLGKVLLIAYRPNQTVYEPTQKIHRIRIPQ